MLLVECKRFFPTFAGNVSGTPEDLFCLRTMSKNKGVDVLILNPVSGRGYTSRKKANEYVARKLAKWNGDCLEFLTHGPFGAFQASVAKRKSSTEMRLDANYDLASSSGLASLKSIRNTPMVGDIIQVLMRRTKTTRYR